MIEIIDNSEPFLNQIFVILNNMIVGKAVKQTKDGECEERSYTNGVLDGEATVIFPDGSKEIRTYRVFKQYRIVWF